MPSDLCEPAPYTTELHAIPPPPRKAGRPVGWRAETYTKLALLTIEDFSFVRGVMGGMEPRAAYRRFYANRDFDVSGEPIIPHGLEINHHAASLQKRMVEASSKAKEAHIRAIGKTFEIPLPAQASETVQQSTNLSFEAWVDSQPRDFYSENELPALYQEYLEENGGIQATAKIKVVERSVLINDRIKALNYLQTLLAIQPDSGTEVDLWLHKSLAIQLKDKGIVTMGGLVEWISKKGRYWHRSIKGFGPGRAGRVLAWLESDSCKLPPIRKIGLHWASAPALKTSIKPLDAAPDVMTLVYETGSNVATPVNGGFQRRFGIAPLELLLVPSALDGRNGLFRTQAPNHLGANNDYDAVLRWLGTYQTAGKLRTLDAYRREVERFYMWALLKARCALSSISLSQASGYQAFLKKIEPEFISTARVSREDERWRPWRGQLTPSSQNYAIGVIYHMYNALLKNSYVTGNPFESIKPNAAGVSHRAIDTTRSLHSADLALVRDALANLPGLQSKVPREVAFARRTRLILHLALTTGMRLAEMSNTTIKSLRHPIVDGETAEDWLLDVVGKGSKVREVPISQRLRDYILEHHADWEQLMPHAAGRLKEFKNAPPLIAALEAPVRSTSREITDKTELANDNAGLSRGGIYRTLKTFFRQLAKGVKDDEDQKNRILEFSTHWLRHTFAHEVLRANSGDEGLKLTQQLLGHKSISTTAEYVKQDQSAKVKAARKVNPLG